LAELLEKAAVVHVGMVDEDGQPYVVPMHFGYCPQENRLYLHSAREGRKMDILRRRPEVCFEVTAEAEVLPGRAACRFATRYRSVIGWGRVAFLETPDEKIHGLDVLMRKFADGPFKYDPRSLALTAVWRVDIDRMTGKRSQTRVRVG
jgi:nitroimidazol reductase NimA-like FMN-containing flavoprotein (pyridoxamine 5'-phosphate oxidase superfamily)